MTLSAFFKHQDVCGKDVYIVDDHHHALAPWALICRKLVRVPNLITIDHHTDTHEAFLSYAHIHTMNGNDDALALAAKLVKQIDCGNDQSLKWAIEHLRHDEHIHAATVSGVFRNAFCIQLSDSGGNQSIEELAYDTDWQARWPLPPTHQIPHRPMTYEEPANHIFVIPHDCAIGCSKRPHDDDCVMQHGNMIIESIYLGDQLERGAEISRCIGLCHIEEHPYILDIDLDAFHSLKAINPADPSIFYRLIRNAMAITIATEAKCVEELKFDGELINAEMLLDRLIEHIKAAQLNKEPVIDIP